MNIVKKQITDLIPAPYNPRKDLQPDDKEYQQLKRSIEEFGYVEPIIYNIQTGLVVGGHQRLKVLQDLGYEEVDCVEIDIDETKEKALNVALNKISGDWDELKLNTLLKELDTVDLELTGFNIEDLDLKDFKDTEFNIENVEDTEESEEAPKEKEYDPSKKFDDENWMKFIPIYDGYYGIPLVQKDESFTREFFEGVQAIDCEDAQYRPPEDSQNYCMHFFREDYKFTKYWEKPDLYIDVLKKYKFVIAPDFSTYMDYPYAFQIWNLYRKNWLAAYWQSIYDIKVVPLLSWSDEESFKFCFDGIEEGSVVAVCNKGTLKDEETNKSFIKGYKMAMEKIEPSLVLFFDTIPEELKDDSRIIRFSSMQTQRERQRIAKEKE